MRKILSILMQFLLFLVTFLVGSFLVPFHMRQVLSVTSEGTHAFIWDGVVLVGVLMVIILLIEALRKRLEAAGVWTALAAALAIAAGLVMKLGFTTS